MSAAVTAAEEAAASKLQRLSQEHAAALAAQATAHAAAEQDWQQKLLAAQAAHQQEMAAVKSAAVADQQGAVAALMAKHEVALEQLMQQKKAAEHAASSQVSSIAGSFSCRLESRHVMQGADMTSHAIAFHLQLQLSSEVLSKQGHCTSPSHSLSTSHLFYLPAYLRLPADLQPAVSAVLQPSQHLQSVSAAEAAVRQQSSPHSSQ